MRQAFHLLRFEKADGVVHLRLLAFAAFGLELAELAEGLLRRPVQALFVDAEVHEGFRIVAEGAGSGHGGVDFRAVRIVVEISGGFEVAHAEHAVFDGADAPTTGASDARILRG
jgi:hypothetical protein